MPRRGGASSDEDDEGNIEGIVNDSEVEEDNVSTEPEEEEASMSDDSTSEEGEGDGDSEDGADGGPSANKGPRKRARRGGDDDGEGPDKAAARTAARRETEREAFRLPASLAKIKDLATPAAATAAALAGGAGSGLREPSGVFKPPRLLEGVHMHEHQQAALEWLAAVWQEDRGALLCDQVLWDSGGCCSPLTMPSSVESVRGGRVCVCGGGGA
jgi:hypothetical protein